MNTKAAKSILLQALLFSVYFILLELFFHVKEGLDFSPRFIYPVLFCIPLGLFFAGIFSFFPRTVNCILSALTAVLAAVWFWAQICYSSVFMTYMEISKVTMAGDVAQGFGDEMHDAITGNLPYIVILLVLSILFSLILFAGLKPSRKSPLLCGTVILTCLLLHLCCRAALLAGGTGPHCPAKMYTQYPRILDNNIENFGVLTSFRLEICDLIFGHAPADSLLASSVPKIPDVVPPAPSSDPQKESREEDTLGSPVSSRETPESSAEPVEEIPPEEMPKLKNILDVDFNAMMEEETNEDILAIHQYLNSLPGSNINEYTGYFKGYNLIMICAESFSSRMISQELTPTLYKMSNNGFVFRNYYGMFKSITTNGEYAFCTGLIPNTVGSVNDLKQNSTFLLSADKYLPYCMGNVFRSQGAGTYAAHGNNASYYNREITHPNMGYEVCRFLNGSCINGVFTSENPLVFSNGKKRPNSDAELVDQTMEEILSNKDADGNVLPFHAYYMTYSGHHPYYDIHITEHTKNPMTFENRERVDGLGYSEVVKSYLAANLEVEDMLTLLLEKLKAAGCLENTVIVLTDDHYPYGLQTAQYNELAGEKVDGAFGIYENSFICYNAGMTEPVVVDTPCCTVDILPTLLNLFGADFDSRLLAGTDILDPGSFHIAMLYNQSYITDLVKYNATKGTVSYLTDKESVTDEYLEACSAYVQAKFEVSLKIIQNDYYRIFYDHLEPEG